MGGWVAMIIDLSKGGMSRETNLRGGVGKL